MEYELKPSSSKFATRNFYECLYVKKFLVRISFNRLCNFTFFMLIYKNVSCIVLVLCIIKLWRNFKIYYTVLNYIFMLNGKPRSFVLCYYI